VTFDWDDHHEHNNAMPWMLELRQINPAFRATLFSVPALGSKTFWRSHPDWIEIAWHGLYHRDPYECLEWDADTMDDYLYVLERQENSPCRLWKAPGWQINPDIYSVLLRRGWAVADQHLEDDRRPRGLPVYFYEDGGNWHGHVQNVCGNGLAETWDTVCGLVEKAESFEFASERTVVWDPAVAA
jgi:hypothetical protein